MFIKANSSQANIFSILGIASNLMRDKSKKKEMIDRATKEAHSYEEAIEIINEYMDDEIVIYN